MFTNRAIRSHASKLALCVAVIAISVAVVPSLASGAKPSKPKPKPKPVPDLVVTSSVPTQMNQAVVASGFKVSVRAAKASVGGGTVTKVYLSTNAKVDKKDTVIAAIKMSAIKQGKTATVVVKPAVPSALSGRLYVLVCADSTSKVAETSERNNCASRAAVPVDVVRPVVAPTSWIEGTPESLFVLGASLYYRNTASSTATTQFSVTDQGLGIATATSRDGYTVVRNDAGAAVTGGVTTADFFLEVVDAAGNTASAEAVTAPAGAITGNKITVASAKLVTTQVPFTFVPGANTPIGMASWQLIRASAPYTNGACGAYGEYLPIGAANPVSPYTDTVPGEGCYKYGLTSIDNVGTTETLKDSSTVRVDLPADDEDEDEDE